MFFNMMLADILDVEVSRLYHNYNTSFFSSFTISELVEISPLFVVITHLALEIISVFVFQ